MLNQLVDIALLVVSSIFSAQTYIEDGGPGNVFITSHQATIRRGESSSFWRFVSEAIDCYKCLSMWLSMALLLLRAVSRNLYMFITIPLTIAALADLWQTRRT